MLFTSDAQLAFHREKFGRCDALAKRASKYARDAARAGSAYPHLHVYDGLRAVALGSAFPNVRVESGIHFFTLPKNESPIPTAS